MAEVSFLLSLNLPERAELSVKTFETAIGALKIIWV